MSGSKKLDLEDLYHEYKDMVFRVSFRFSRGDKEWAMDRVQDVFLRLAERWDILPEIENHKAFIYRITMNLCINKVRRKKNIFGLMVRFFKPGKEIATAIGVDFKSPDDHAHQNDVLKKLDEAIAQLPPKHQGVVIMYYLEDIGIPAIADILELNKGTISRRLKSAHEKLAVILGERWLVENDNK
jgi:RNA polymerase sigma-70 factor, ECF subfamily